MSYDFSPHTSPRVSSTERDKSPQPLSKNLIHLELKVNLNDPQPPSSQTKFLLLVEPLTILFFDLLHTTLVLHFSKPR